jgi:REP element-mobilizing transposase RayT
MDHDPRYWHNRGYLPHFDKAGFSQFITFRLADSMPQEVLDLWRLELDNRGTTEANLRRRIEYYLDQNYGNAYLRDRDVAAMVQETLLKFDEERYKLIAWVLMPNHGHILLTPCDGHTVPDIMHSIKSYTAHEANKILHKKGPFWEKEYFDRFIRDGRHFASTIAYIENNPVKARLCEAPEHWPFGSACFRRKN